jgi:hypothetical protein
MVLNELNQALGAAMGDDWDTAVFHLDQARLHTVDMRGTRRPYDVIVYWHDNPDNVERTEWVRVTAGSRALALNEGAEAAREMWDLGPEKAVKAFIDPDSPL